MAKIISLAEAAALVKDGSTVMIGGFMGCGNPHTLVDALLDYGVRELTLIAADAGKTGYGLGKLVDEHRVKKLIVSHVGLNPNVALQMNEGSVEVTLLPQGTLAECIHAGGAGLGGALTPTGLGTTVAEGKQTITIQGKTYLVEEAIRADLALICGCWVDRRGNVWYKGTTKNFNQLMAMAADTVICEADHIVEPGSIKPENVATPGVFVDYIVQGKGAPAV
jgi:acetate CoA/acetoacetate CoA-transferase alpha subunit